MFKYTHEEFCEKVEEELEIFDEIVKELIHEYKK